MTGADLSDDEEEDLFDSSLENSSEGPTNRE